MSNCHIVLTAQINVMPLDNSDCMIVMHEYFCRDTEEQVFESYRVFLKHGDVKRINAFGYVGATLLVHGKLRLTDAPEIIADKIELLAIPNNSQPQPEFLFDFDRAETVNTDMTSLFERAQREMHIHVH